jgi:uncharacterized protein YjbJ (UPF0337 family)
LLEKPLNKSTKNQMMNTKLNMNGSWDVVKGELKQKYANLTDDDLLFVEGKENELLGRLELKLGKPKEEIGQDIEMVIHSSISMEELEFVMVI